MANICVISGRLTKDPTVKYAQNGMAIANFTVAVNAGKNETYFINCKAFDKTAQTLEKWATKGRLVIVCGHIKTGSYNGKDGKPVFTTEIITDRLEFLDKKVDSTPDEIDRQSQMQIPEGFSELEEDIPF